MKLQGVLLTLTSFVHLQTSVAQDARHEGQKPLISHAKHSPKRVAIIGAGSAGASTAYYLRQHARDADIPLHITVYERNNYVGGRSTTVHAFDDTSQPVELGASIFVQVNHNLVNATQALNLTLSDSKADRAERRKWREEKVWQFCYLHDLPRASDLDIETARQLKLKLLTLAERARFDACRDSIMGRETKDDRQVIGIWNGLSFVLRQPISGISRFESWWATLKLLWRYGLAPLRAQSLMRNTVGRFLRLYEESHFPWRGGLTQAVFEVGLEGATSETGADYLRQYDVTDPFAWEVVQAATRVNYAQNLAGIHGLEAMVCMATDGAMSVRGGNWQIFDGMLTAADVELKTGEEVKNLIKLENGTYVLGTGDHKSEGGTFIDEGDNGLREESHVPFDVVVIAAPFHQTGLEIEPEPKHTPDDVPYVKLFVTLFTSPHGLTPSVFNLESDEEVPSTILSTLPPYEHPGANPDPDARAGTPGFFSISRLGTVLNPKDNEAPRAENLYKIFSPHALKDEELLRLIGLQNSTGLSAEFGHRDHPVSWVHRKEWLSYPFLYPRVTFEEQKLDHGLWYTGGIESFISTMETSSLMGSNVARLIVDGWLEDSVGSGLRHGNADEMEAKIDTGGDEL